MVRIANTEGVEWFYFKLIVFKNPFFVTEVENDNHLVNMNISQKIILFMIVLLFTVIGEIVF